MMDIWDYIKNPDEKRVYQRKIATKVNENIDSYNEELNSRRRRLQYLLVNEENQLKDEQRQYEKTKLEYIKQKQNEELEALEIQKNKEQEMILASKLIQIDMAKCKEIQPLIRKRRDLETFEIQKKQIQEQKEKIEKSQELDKMWYMKMMGDAERNKMIEEQKAKEKTIKEVSMKEFLTAQMQISQEIKKREKIKFTEEVIKSVEECDKQSINRVEKESKAKQEKTLKLAEDLKNQMIQNQERRKKEKEIEINIENRIATSSLSKENEFLSKKAEELKKYQQEFKLYGQHAEALKLEREAREKATELAVLEEAKKQIEENEKRKKLETKRSIELLKEAITVRDSQLVDKKKELEKASHIAAEEIRQREFKESFNKQEEIRKKQESARAKSEYRRFLEEQIKRKKISEEYQKSQYLSEIEQQNQKEKQFNNKMVELMKRQFASEKTHPFTKVTTNNSQDPTIPDTPYCKY